MINLETSYLGLKIKNPIIVSSSGLTNSIDKIKQIESAGAGALVLKSLFEEQINHEAGDLVQQSQDYPEAEDYIRSYAKSNSVEEYLSFLEAAVKEVNIPVIASINCISSKDWTGFARQIEEAGAAALELNIHIVTTNPDLSSEEYEKKYLDIVETVRELISIPLVVKIGSGFSNLPGFISKLYHRKINGVVLFNRFYQPDIDIDTLSFTTSGVFSSPEDIKNSLRWVGITSDLIKGIDISASTGVHDGKAAIKLLLAGAQSVQVCSILYKMGISYLGEIIDDVEKWMEEKGYSSIEDFRGKMSYSSVENPAIYERAQFMKHFSSYI